MNDETLEKNIKIYSMFIKYCNINLIFLIFIYKVAYSNIFIIVIIDTFNIFLENNINID